MFKDGHKRRFKLKSEANFKQNLQSVRRLLNTLNVQTFADRNWWLASSAKVCYV